MRFFLKSKDGQTTEVEAWKEGKGWRARCPFHNDHRPSLFIYPDGFFICFGCRITGNVITEEDEKEVVLPKEKLSLHEFAIAKNLPEGFLWKNFVRDSINSENGLIFSYLDEDGDPEKALHRYRHSLYGSKRFSWKKGAQPIPYGLWKLESFDRNKPLIICEGESDALTLWYCDIQAIGIPGVNAWKTEFSRYIRDFKKIFVIVEPNSKGVLYENVRKTLNCTPLYFDYTPYKDPSEAYISLGRDKFIDFMNSLISQAKEIRTGVILPLKELETEPVQWSVPEWFAKGVINLLAGQPGIGKTTLILNILALVSTGQGKIPSKNGFQLIHKQKSLYISLEDDLSRKVKPVFDALDVGDSDNISVASAESVVELMELVKKASGFDIIVVDPLTNLITNDVNKIDYVTNLLRPLSRIARVNNSAVVIVWHLNKSGDVLGSVVFKSIPKTILLLAKDGDSLILTQSKNAFSRPLPSLRLRIREGIVNFIGFSDSDVGEVRGEKENMIRDFLLELFNEKDSWTFDEIKKIAKEEGFNPESVRTVGQRLVRKGIIVKNQIKSVDGKFVHSVWKIANKKVREEMFLRSNDLKIEDYYHRNTLEETGDDYTDTFKNSEFHEDTSSELKGVSMVESLDLSQSEPKKQCDSVSVAKEKIDRSGDTFEKETLNGTPKPELERFLSYLNFTSQKSREKLGLLRDDEPIDLDWMR